MNDWQNRFAKRLNALREKSNHDFAAHIENELQPAVKEMAGYVETGGLTAQVLEQTSREVFATRFFASPQVYMDVIFTLHGPLEVEASYRLHHPQRREDEVCPLAIVALADAREGWARQQLQMALDVFLISMERLLDPIIPDTNNSAAA